MVLVLISLLHTVTLYNCHYAFLFCLGMALCEGTWCYSIEVHAASRRVPVVLIWNEPTSRMDKGGRPVGIPPPPPIQTPEVFELVFLQIEIFGKSAGAKGAEFFFGLLSG